MNINPLVTVLMANMNNEEFLKDSIQSILNQTYQNLELIVIDDGSTDDSVHIINAFQQQDARLIFIHNEINQGTSVALNQGLALARGKFITRQDSDDISLPDRIEKQLGLLIEKPYLGAASSAVYLIDQHGELGAVAYQLEDLDIGITLLDTMCICGPTLMVNRSVFEAIGYQFSPDLSYSEDYDLALRVSEVSKIENINHPLYKYRQHASSVSIAKRNIQMYNKAVALERSLERRGTPTSAKNLWLNVSRDYLRAAVLAVTNQDTSSAKQSIEQALRVDSEILNQFELVDNIIRRYSPKNNPDAAFKFFENVFDLLLPINQGLRKSKYKLLAACQAEWLLSGKILNKGFTTRDIWFTVKNDPRWLGNRGIWSLFFKSIMQKIGMPSKNA